MSRWVIHPFLIAVFPILSVYARNASQTPARELYLPIAIVLAVTAVLWLALGLLSRDARRAGLVVSLGLVLFFTISVLPEALDGVSSSLSRYWVPREVHLWPPLVVVPEIGLFAALGYLAFAKLKDPRGLTSFLNVFALVLVALPASGTLNARGGAVPGRREGVALATASDPGRLPDIYYIILDGYARTDVMDEFFGFDNAPFLERLEHKGFFVARRSTSNYCQTRLSVPSSLNVEYLDKFADDSTSDTTWLRGLIGANTVVKTLRNHGYQFATFSTGFDLTEHPQADIYLSPHLQISDFHRLLLGSTPLTALLPDSAGRDQYTMARERTLYVLETLPKVAKREGPTFTMAHILAPHPPFVFGEDGEDVSPRHLRFILNDGDLYDRHYGDDRIYAEGYRAQAAFLTREIERVIGRILEDSPEPPIIILQSDHGSGMKFNLESLEATDLRERMGILNAYYFPGRNQEGLHDRITPVNSFRVVLNRYFGAQLELLEDRNYFSTSSEPFKFFDVTEKLKTGPARTPQGTPEDSPDPREPGEE